MVLDRLASVLRGAVEINGTRSAPVNALLVAAVLLAVGSVGYTAVLTEGNHRYTEFYLLSENESGELVAEDYPDSVEADTSSTFHVGIENHLGDRTRYAVVVKLQRMYLGNETPEVLDEQVFRPTRVRVSDDDRRVEAVEVTPEMRGNGMRFVFLLYRGDPPSEPSRDNAYQRTHLWTNVTAPSDDGNASESLAA